MYEIFKKSYENDNIKDFFAKEQWSILFPKITKFCADEIAKGNLKLFMKESSSNPNAEIYMIFDKDCDINDYKGNVIGAVQIIVK